MRRYWMLVAISTFAAVTCEQSADAGVRNGRFQGTVFNSFGNLVTVDDTFFSDGTLRQIESSVNTFYGPYSERGLLITSWSASLSDGSPDGKGMVFGMCFFGQVITHLTLNTDISISAAGILYRTGKAENASKPLP